MEDTFKKSRNSSDAPLTLSRLEEMRQNIKRRRDILERTRIGLKQQKSMLEAQREWLQAARSEYANSRPQRVRGL